MCESNLGDFLEEAKSFMYGSSGDIILPTLAPLLMDICRGMTYLHSRNIVHGGRL